MKKLEVEKDSKSTRPPRTVVTKEEALKRMKEFTKRKGQFLATARTGKTRSVHS